LDVGGFAKQGIKKYFPNAIKNQARWVVQNSIFDRLGS
jgi:hypothetical protein